MGYQPINDYGIVGDLQTAALIGKDGSVDWLCLPRFDSPSVFAAILDDLKGGRFKMAPAANTAKCEQLYKPGTNILVTRFFTPEGVGEVLDFMPMRPKVGSREPSRLIRCVRAVSGALSFRLECTPGFNYARDTHRTHVVSGGALFHSSELSLALISPVPLQPMDRGVEATFSIQESETVTFVLRPMLNGSEKITAASEIEMDEVLEETAQYWQRWIGKCSYTGRWREMVHRSALLLELLTYEPTGAIVAAPTCSLPELIGGARNWDYRYNWVRDAAFTIYGLLRIGLTDEASRFMTWMEERCGELAENGGLQTVYAIDGRSDLHEETLDHLQGYCASRPVRAGNGAYRQLQLDIYGALVDAVYLYNKYGAPISSELWRDLRRLIDWVCDYWQHPDHGIWEIRGEPRQHVHSKLMCWVTLDRGLRLAEKRSFPTDRSRWLKCRDQIYEEILTKGWNEERQAFVQSYGSSSLDASVLMMPLVFFMSPTGPMMAKTVDAISKSVSKRGLLRDGRVFRYDPTIPGDGLPPGEGTFNMCTFWLVEALTRMGRLDEAQWLFEKMLARANHLGLYSEETGPCGEALGNFPQAFTHMGLISAAFNLDRALGTSQDRKIIS